MADPEQVFKSVLLTRNKSYYRIIHSKIIHEGGGKEPKQLWIMWERELNAPYKGMIHLIFIPEKIQKSLWL